jgi:hypothetical protein
MKLIDGVLDFCSEDEVRVDGIAGVYRLSEHPCASKCTPTRSSTERSKRWWSCATFGTDHLGWRRRRSSLECSGRSSHSQLPTAATTKCASTSARKKPPSRNGGGRCEPRGGGTGGSESADPDNAQSDQWFRGREQP